MEGRIFRSPSTDNFTVLPNEVLQSNKLSFGARGLLVYMLSFPPAWKLYKSVILQHAQEGKDKLNTLWNELEIHGYITTDKERNDKGRYVYTYTVRDTPFTGQIIEGSGSQPGREIRSGTRAGNPQLENNKILSLELELDSVNTSKGSSRKKILNALPGIFTRFVTRYDQLCKAQLNIGCKMDAVQGASLKKIISYLLAQAGGDEVKALGAWDYICTNWPKLDKWHQGQIKLSQINSNLLNIINALRNGQNNTYDQFLADLDRPEPDFRRPEGTSEQFT